MASVEDPETTTCENSCWFSGSSQAHTNNLCSMCFDDYHLVNETNMLPRINITLKKTSNNIYSLLTCGHLVYLVRVVKRFLHAKNDDDDDDDEVNDVKNNTYCEYVCDNKVGFFGARCDCGGRFCDVHRLPEEHACKYTAVRELVIEFLKEKSAWLPIEVDR